MTVMVTAANPDVRRALAEAVQFERRPDKIDMVVDALALAPAEPEIMSLKASFARHAGRQMRRKGRRK